MLNHCQFSPFCWRSPAIFCCRIPRSILPLNILRVIVGPYPFFEVYHQPVYVSVLWAVGLLGVNYLYAWLLWHLGGGRPRSAR